MDGGDLGRRDVLILTVGLPRSGKTTWAHRRLIHRSHAGFHGIGGARYNTPPAIVSPDQIRLALHGQRYVQSAEPHVWAIAHTMVKALFLAGHDTVILDATNTTKARRDEWKSANWETRFVLVGTPPGLCIERALLENDQYIVSIIERMAAQLEPLDGDEAARVIEVVS